jgi:LysM repeat protein
MGPFKREIIPGYILEASTPGNAGAPITYAINGITVGPVINNPFKRSTASASSAAGGFVPTPDEDVYTVFIGSIAVFTGTSGTADSFIANLPNARSVLDAVISESVTTTPTLDIGPVNPSIPIINPPSVLQLDIGPVENAVPVSLFPVLGISPPPIPNDVPNLNINSTEYTIKKGDTLSLIATKFNITVEALLKANPKIRNPNLIFAGEKITIPGKAEAVPPAETAQPNINANPTSTVNGITGAKENAAAQATAQDQANFAAAKDWRVRLALAPGANYLYKSASYLYRGILDPLEKTDGVIFPYTPAINVTYSAKYSDTDLIHNNYKVHQYQNSSVDQISITGTFTCQDVFEANYLLAVIHFFRSMTKMFYGQDSNPKNGTPPPLCYIYGMGGYQFDALPLAISGFTYNLPQDVDYIPTTGAFPAGTPQPTVLDKNTDSSVNSSPSETRLRGIIGPGGTPSLPSFPSTPSSSINQDTTWVPTKIELAISCLAVMSRNLVSNKFSLRDYGTGQLLRGSGKPYGGMW